MLPVSAFNKGELLRFAKPRRYKLVYNAVDLPEVDLSRPRKKQVVTVGAVEKTYSRLKGHERFIAAAHLLPDVRFIVVGPARDGTPGETLYLKQHRIRSGKQTIVLTVPRLPTRAGVDPYRKLIERERDERRRGRRQIRPGAGQRDP